MRIEEKTRLETRAQVLKAIAHPTRLFIVEELSRGERCVQDLTGMVEAPRASEPPARFTMMEELYLMDYIGRFDPLLTGVDVIAFPDGHPSDPWRYDRQDNPTSSLLVLLTPQERDFLQSLPRLYATPVAPDTERTSLDPAARAQLLEQLDPGSGESE